MAIAASHIVNINPRVITGGSADLEFNGLLLADNPIISASTLVLHFPGAEAVSAYFGSSSVEYEAAKVYFTSYNNKLSSPPSFLVARRVALDAAAWLRSAKLTRTLAQFKAITDGALTISIDNTVHAVSGVDFSSAASFSDVAAILRAKMPFGSDSVTYSSLTNAFTITSGTTGASSEVGYGESPSAGTDLALFMGLREADGAVISKGMNALSVNEQMEAILAKTQNWVSFTTAWEESTEDALEWAEWSNSHYGWLYVAYTTSPTTISPDSTTDMASAIKTAGYDHSTVVYGSLEYAGFIMGTIAAIAWQRLNGTITAAFKRQSGLAATVTDEATATTLESKKCNYFGNFATRNAEFVFLYPGLLSASEYDTIAAYINSVWLNNRLQVSLMDGLTNTGRTSYNTRGYTMIKAWMADPVNEAKNNGTIEPGIVLSERQKSEVMNEAGLDISDELWTNGYYVQVLDPGAAIRAQHGSPIISLWYTYGGEVLKLDVASTAIL